MSFLGGVKKRAVVVVAMALWVPAVSFGISVLWRYSSTPGLPAKPPLDWPANAPVQPRTGRATLVMFAHPQCPCSRATIGELAVIMARAAGKVDALVFFYLPAGEAREWAKTGLWRSASAIPGVQAREDRENAFARIFGASTSGQALLYDQRGTLVFKGGITASRGHSGDNYGRDAIIALIHGESVSRGTAPVFGCSLRDSSQRGE